MPKTEMIDGQEFTVTQVPVDENAIAEARAEQAEEWQGARYSGPDEERLAVGIVTNRPSLNDMLYPDESEGLRNLMQERARLGCS